jgi:hypothetical protein
MNWTDRKAAGELCFAEWVVPDLPQVHAGLLAGRLDRDKAWVFADHLNDLSAPLQTSIWTALVGPAAGWTAGKLANRLRRMILETDPDWAARRYRKAIHQRGVTAYLDQDGTMTISGQGLAPDEAAAAIARIDELAAGIRRAGHPSLLPQIRADLYVGLLDGTLPHHNRAEIITAMLERVRPEDAEPAPPDTTEDGASGNQASEEQGRENADGTGSGVHATDRDTDTDGHIVFGGLTRRRPLPPVGRPPRRSRGGSVELHIPAELLVALTGGGPGAVPAGLSSWAPVLADTAAQYADRERLLAPLDARPGDRFHPGRTLGSAGTCVRRPGPATVLTHRPRAGMGVSRRRCGSG